MRQHHRSAGDGASAPTHRPRAGAPNCGWTLANVARASVDGALALAAAQMVDMRLTGRPGSETPLATFEAVSRRRVRSPAARSAVGYAVQSSLAPVGAIAAVLAGKQTTRRYVAAALTPLAVVGTVGPAVGASAWPWRWTRSDWTRELALKSVLALAIVAALRSGDGKPPDDHTLFGGVARVPGAAYDVDQQTPPSSAHRVDPDKANGSVA
jgi:hypothetical protein